jgi:hypothetical protein
MKQILNEWRDYIENSTSKIMYHTTANEESAQSILTNGLIADSETPGFTQMGSWADSTYGGKPIYLSFEKGRAGDGRLYEGTTFQVDITGIELYPDLPTLVDFGAFVDEDGLSWHENEPEILSYYLDDGFVSFEDLMDPDSPVASVAMTLTKTAVSLISISPDKIKRL